MAGECGWFVGFTFVYQSTIYIARMYSMYIYLYTHDITIYHDIPLKARKRIIGLVIYGNLYGIPILKLYAVW